MDLLTGQNKANFKIWYANWQEQNDYYKAFHKLPFAMQEGVLKEYYRSIGYIIDAITDDFNSGFYSIVYTLKKEYSFQCFKIYEEAMKQAFKTANELMNKTTTP